MFMKKCKDIVLKCLSSDEKLFVSLISEKVQTDFESNTIKYVEDANLSLMTFRKMSELPTQDRMNTMWREREYKWYAL